MVGSVHILSDSSTGECLSRCRTHSRVFDFISTALERGERLRPYNRKPFKRFHIEMESVPGAVATGCASYCSPFVFTEDPVATAPGTDFVARGARPDVSEVGFAPPVVSLQTFDARA
jgi:hypothetical protein